MLPATATSAKSPFVAWRVSVAQKSSITRIREYINFITFYSISIIVVFYFYHVIILKCTYFLALELTALRMMLFMFANNLMFPAATPIIVTSHQYMLHQLLQTVTNIQVIFFFFHHYVYSIFDFYQLLFLWINWLMPMMCFLSWTDLKWVLGGGVPIFGLLFLVYVVALYITRTRRSRRRISPESKTFFQSKKCPCHS